MKKYVVELSNEERTELQAIINAKRMAAHKRKHAQILLKADQGPDGPGWNDERIAQAFDCTVKTVERLRNRLIERGFERVLDHGNQGSVKLRKIDGEVEAHLVALACGPVDYLLMGAVAGRFDYWPIRWLPWVMLIPVVNQPYMWL